MPAYAWIAAGVAVLALLVWLSRAGTGRQTNDGGDGGYYDSGSLYDTGTSSGDDRDGGDSCDADSSDADGGDGGGD